MKIPLKLIRRNRLACLCFLPAFLVVAATHLCSEIRILSLETAVGFVPGLPSPGSLAIVFCTGLTNISGVIQASGPQLPRTLAAVQVQVGSSMAPILAVAAFDGYQQVNFQVPWESTALSVAVQQGDQRSAYTAAAPQGWPVFFVDSAGNVAAQHASDFQPVTRANPARPGEWIVAYGTNLGPVYTPPPTGVPAPIDRLLPIDQGPDTWQLLLSAGGGTTVGFMGLAPGQVGVYQINFRLPDNPNLHDVDISVQIVRLCGIYPVPGVSCLKGLNLTTSYTAHLPVQ